MSRARKRVIIHLVAGARPNFMKVAPVYHALRRAGWGRPLLVHTGQHYDASMSATFLRDLGMSDPDCHLGVGGRTHAEQTARVMVAYERACMRHRPDWTVVVGDVNSTLACALVAKKLGVAVAHLEAGLRSFDRSMPEEINRLLTDALSDLLWTPSPDADANLRREGIPPERIVRVGNIMIDSYEMLRERIEAARTCRSLGLAPRAYGVVTLHRPANVDRRQTLARLVGALAEICPQLPLVFPVHPRTRRRLEAFGLWARVRNTRGLRPVGPMGYIRFMSLVRDARLVITDSGGLQEETTYLDIPCLTLRENTERPITTTQGTNRLVGAATLRKSVQEVLRSRWVSGTRPAFWDGHAADRVVESLRRVIRP